ncbi:MAG: hypothetical protein GEU73_12040 [Chloroflexi bacterium]|nr:hypothetical protein [Chloroflexota bacterium]
MISVGGVDLIYLSLRLVASSVETLQRQRGHDASPSGRGRPSAARKGEGGPPQDDEAAPPNGTALHPPTHGWYPPLVTRPDVPEGEPGAVGPDVASEPDRESGEESPERGLARLVLALIELLRELVERQAVRRMEGGSLTADQVERMGFALMELEAKMTELQQLFRLEREDLNLDLGPLGRLLS